MKHPLHPATAKRMIVAILKSGILSFSDHATEERMNDGLDEADCVNVLRGGVCRIVEFRNSSWRYRFETSRIAAVVVFRSETHAVVVTVFRL